MLTDDLKQQIRDAVKRIATSLPGFTTRPGQRAMFAAVANTLSYVPEDNAPGPIAVIEGPTGTGKSLGYLIPGIVMALHHKVPLIVSTATVALQEQIAHKDLSFLREHSGLPFTYAIARGRSRFACPWRMSLLTDSGSQESLPGIEEAAWDYPPTAETLQELTQLAKRLADGAWDGIRDTLATPVPEALWSKITTDRQGCGEDACPKYETCPFYAHKKQLQGATVVVANHDLVLSHLAVGAEGAFNPAEGLWVLDEAHHLPSKVTSHFAKSMAVRATAKRLLKERERLGGIAAMMAAGSEWRQKTDSLISALGEKLGYLAIAMQSLKPQANSEGILRFGLGQLPDELASLVDEARTLSHALAEQLGEARRLTEDLAKDSRPALSMLLGRLERTAEDVATPIALFAYTPEGEGHSPAAKWIQFTPQDNGEDVVLNSSRIDPGPLLRNLFWGRVRCAIATSATLQTLGSFASFRSRVGLAGEERCQTFALPSPFNFTEQGVLVIPQMTSDPGKTSAHTEEIAAAMPAMIEANSFGTLVIFASRRQMEEVYESLPGPIQSKVLMQGKLEKAELLRQHKAKIDFGESSTLFGLSGLSEGIDLQGHYCTHVIVAKLAFPVPTSPLEEAAAEWVEAKGGNPFMEISLPEAAQRLAQTVGRLIRTESDTGMVTILDTRILTKRYGKSLLAGLPAFSRQFGSPLVESRIPLKNEAIRSGNAVSPQYNDADFT